MKADEYNTTSYKNYMSYMKDERTNSASHLRRSIDHVTQIDRLERSGAID